MEPREILDNLVDVSAGCVCIESKEGECICSKEKVKALSQLASWVRGKEYPIVESLPEERKMQLRSWNIALESIAKELEG